MSIAGGPPAAAAAANRSACVARNSSTSGCRLDAIADATRQPHERDEQALDGVGLERPDAPIGPVGHDVAAVPAEVLHEFCRRHLDHDARRHAARPPAQRPLDARARLVVGHRLRLEPHPGLEHLAHAVEPERAPVVAIAIPREQVPATGDRHQPVGLDRASGCLARGIRVPESQSLGIATGQREQAEQFGVDLGCRAARAAARRTRPDRRVRRERVDAPPQRGRQHLLDLRQGAERGVLGAAQPGGRLRAQAHRDRDALVVAEQQRRQPGAGFEPIAAGAPPHRLDAVAEFAQPLDVAAQGAVAHAEAIDEFARRPVPVTLQQ